MNLIIDVGNTNIKLAVFNQDDKLIDKQVVKVKYLKSSIKNVVKEYASIKNVILSSVGKLEASDLDYIESNFNTLILDFKTKLPFNNLYKTPKTLGVDRIALVCASVKQYRDNNVLIIDAGTCITYDFITSDNDYMGGAISPGIRVRYQSLNNLTANLPLLDTKMPKNIIGNSTKNSIHSGVINGVFYEIDGVISEYKLEYEDLTVILTGGDAKFLSKQLKSSIFANSNFLLEGLNFILDFNKN